METATETERKYDVPADFVLPSLAGAAGVSESGEAEIHELDATYFDTEDLRLARNKRTLRRRTGGSDAGWHLKTPAEGSSRTEHRVPLTDGDEVPAELTSVVRTIVRTRPLRPVARLRTHRVETPLRDAEGIHRMRVATRRLRSTLKTFKASFDPQRAVFLRGELKWLADVLGAVRDGQVLSQKLLVGTEDFPQVAARIRAKLEADVARGQQELVAALDGDRYLALLDAVDDLADDPEPDDAGALRKAAKVVRKADRLLDEATADEEDGELHEARKAYKQARYAVEVFAPSAGKRGKGLVKALTGLQDVLGAHQDSVVAREVLQEVAEAAHAEGENTFAYGIVHARQERIGELTLQDLPEAVAASRAPKLRSWLG